MPPPKPLAHKKYYDAAHEQKAWIEKNAHSYKVFNNKEKRITDKLQANQSFVEGYVDFDIAFQDGRGKGGGKGGPWQPLDKETQGSHRVILMVENKGKAGLELSSGITPLTIIRTSTQEVIFENDIIESYRKARAEKIVRDLFCTYDMF